MSKKFYVIWKGAKTGIFNTWPEVQQHTAGRSDAQYMGFESKYEAESAFASTYTKALMQRSLSKKGGKTAAPTSTRKTTSTAKGTATSKSVTTSPNAKSDIEIYCDGACSPNPGKSGTGLAVYEHGKVTSLYYGLYLANGTNNTAELNGLLSSFQIAQHFIERNKTAGTDYSICILSDSKYSIDCITKWAKGWQAKGWTRGKGEEVKNLALVQQCYALYKTIQSKITIRHVKGHANIEGNELADRMAVLARKQQQENMTRYAEAIDIKAILAMESG
ncbi:viroplasmin family protein [Colwellia sp. E2M01]|uniref:ribonuclease H family protein n=1 Tax=Colwellia sp. E2M01 TaxID=2841561 RepID=UPI001C0982F5|nr:viroplasmin family protein [Colwellia sp. E2M01]MBU2871069.1 ribonuclease H family protein [Colwellia sp. E2M01]